MMNKEIKQLGKEICEYIGNQSIEDIGEVVINGTVYTFDEVADLGYEEVGASEVGEFIWAVREKDSDEILLHINQISTRYWNYEDGFEYCYEVPFIVEKREVIAYEWVSVEE